MGEVHDVRPELGNLSPGLSGIFRHDVTDQLEPDLSPSLVTPEDPLPPSASEPGANSIFPIQVSLYDSLFPSTNYIRSLPLTRPPFYR